MTITRVGCYVRVSTEEQALRGFSIDTQMDNLFDFCQKNEMKIVDFYSDEGVSGGKAAGKRPEMARLLADVEAGKIDMILFTKLDRWFRNIQEYFKVQEILEKYKVEWKAIHEDYDTTTANGRMAITIFLAIAQNEREKTSERIKVVFEHKRKNKEACFGGTSAPWGYKKEPDENGVMRAVKDPETREACEMFWELMVKYENLSAAARTMAGVYGYTKSRRGWQHIMKSSIYCGVYHGVEDYCEPYVSKEDWVRINEKRPIRATKNNRVYLFTGLMKCPNCGKNLSGSYVPSKFRSNGEDYHNYKCKDRVYNRCDWGKTISENVVERYLLNNLQTLLEEEVARVELEQSKPKPKPKVNIKALKEKQRRLNVMYMAGNVSDEDYLREDAELKEAIKKAEQEAPPEANRDLTPLKAIMETDVRSIYETLNREDKRRFWRGLIKEIKVEGNRPTDVIFF